MTLLTKTLYPLVNEKSWRSLLVKDDKLQLINQFYKTEEEFTAAYEKKGIFKTKKEIAIADITRMAHPENNPKRLYVTVLTKKLFFDFTSQADLEEVANYLQKERRFTAETKGVSKFRAVTPSLIGLGLTALLTWLVWMDATALEAGEEVDTSGRRAWFKMLIAWVAEQLGSRNTLILGGVIVLVFVWLMIKAIQNPPNEVVYE